MFQSAMAIIRFFLLRKCFKEVLHSLCIAPPKAFSKKEKPDNGHCLLKHVVYYN